MYFSVIVVRKWRLLLYNYEIFIYWLEHSFSNFLLDACLGNKFIADIFSIYKEVYLFLNSYIFIFLVRVGLFKILT